VPVAVQRADIRKAGEELGARGGALGIGLDRDEGGARAERRDDPGGADTGSAADLREAPAGPGRGESAEQPADLANRRALEAQLLGERFGAEDELGDAPYDGVTRYASKTASTFLSAVSSVRSAFTSPSSAVYQFFAS
jgi:hypothetical protein